MSMHIPLLPFRLVFIRINCPHSAREIGTLTKAHPRHETVAGPECSFAATLRPSDRGRGRRHARTCSTPAARRPSGSSECKGRAMTITDDLTYGGGWTKFISRKVGVSA